MTINQNDIVRCVVKCNIGGTDHYNVFHLKKLTATGEADADFMDRADDYFEDAYITLNGLLTPEFQYDTIEYFNVTQDTPVGERSFPTLTTGSGSGDTLPRQAAALVRFTTATPGSQGRKFVSGFGEPAQSAGGLLVATAISQLMAYAVSLMTGILDGSTQDYVPGNWNEALGRFVQWAAAVINDYMASQRRRVVGVGT